ncbi:MAG: YggS family pyridoxal phosphate enzyme [Chloroflexi bacterium RBG_19FT_COMBO_62_14]|nr:MAG: YggS family pyridoxal phosphate enzyme [Chloroflexi bacterium RBG_19FT_COMBO_62_14]
MGLDQDTAVTEDIAGSIRQVQLSIAAAAEQADRPPESVTLVAVSKGQPTARIRKAYAAGLREFGENRVEEAAWKLDELSDLSGVHWHLIGHIQSRKTEGASGRFHLIHSVDRLKIARRLDQYSADLGIRQAVLLECNVSGETSKGGWAMSDPARWAGRLEELEQVVGLPSLQIQGLMTMAPLTPDEGLIRSVFHRLRVLQEYLEQRLPGHWSELSMGMSDDYRLAIAEGATIVRIGRAIFGPGEVEG